MTTTTARVTTSEGRSELLQEARGWFARQGLFRVRDEQVLGGVCSGLGRRAGLRPWTARLLFLLLLMLVPGSQLLVYPVLWVLLPLAPAAVPGVDDRTGW